MSRLGFYIALPFLYLLAYMPIRVLYLLSSLLYVLVYHLLGYRRKVVETNLRNAFPDKSPAEIRRLSRKFYRYLCDLLLETFQTLRFSRQEALQRCRFTDSHLFEELATREQSCIIVMGHYGNWEWGGNAMSLLGSHQLYVIYHPLSNAHFNRFIIRMRTRFGTRLVPMQDSLRQMLRMRGERTATAFIADQTPPPQHAYWTTFLNQDTPIFWGTEKIARKLNLPVVYAELDRERRGRYTIRLELLCEHPADTPEGYLSELHTQRLEQTILRKPELWLWSHRRWKHTRPPLPA
ncbi:MAG: lysophospholipid acyltransferase family protein [Bacteroidetes bacterium]|nr:lysophospholipid acyltransferase family protein [Bacteroidota bacterium]